ncbi:5475_t:CDS:2, partial [Gigaspora margarita]
DRKHDVVKQAEKERKCGQEDYGISELRSNELPCKVETNIMKHKKYNQNIEDTSQKGKNREESMKEKIQVSDQDGFQVECMNMNTEAKGSEHVKTKTKYSYEGKENDQENRVRSFNYKVTSRQIKKSIGELREQNQTKVCRVGQDGKEADRV